MNLLKFLWLIFNLLRGVGCTNDNSSTYRDVGCNNDNSSLYRAVSCNNDYRVPGSHVDSTLTCAILLARPLGLVTFL